MSQPEGIRTRRKPNNDFTIVSNSIIYDDALSRSATYLLILMLSHREDWVYFVEEMAKHKRDYSPYLVRKDLRELMEAGYVRRIERPRKNKGRFDGYDYEVDYLKFQDAPALQKVPRGQRKIVDEDGKSTALQYTACGEVDTNKTDSKTRLKNNKTKHVNSPEIQRVDERELVTASPSVSASEFGDVWNEFSGNLPKVRLPLTNRRTAAVRRLQKEHGSDALELFRAAVQAVAQNEFWVKRRYGFDNLMRGKVEGYAEQWVHSGNLSGADVKLLTRAQRIAAALGDDK